MRRAAVCFCVFLAFSSVFPAFAGDRFGLGVKAGTLGLGADITGRITNWLSVRGTFNTADLTRSEEVSDVDYDGDVALGAYGLLLDFHPFKGNFRVSIGYLKNRTGIDLKADPTQPTEIGDTTYPEDQIGTLKGVLDFDDKVPYFGLGYGSAAKGPGRVRFLLDVGVLSQGSGNVTLSSTGTVQDSDLRIEEENIEDDIHDYTLWPVIELGISFRL